MTYDPRESMERYRRRETSSYRTDVKGKYDTIFLNDIAWTPGRLIPGQYPVTVYDNATQSQIIEMPYHPFWQHYWPETRNENKKMFVVCGRGGNDFAPFEQCPACLVQGHDGTMKKYAYNFLGLHYYHKVTTANPKNPTKPYTNWRQCEKTVTNQNCQYCNVPGYDVSLGFYGHLELNRNDQDILEQLNDSLAGRCACGGTIVINRASCPRCHAVIADVDTSGMSDTEFQRLLLHGGVCPSCGAIERYLQRSRRCTKCANPRPLTVFDVNIEFRRPKKENGKYGDIEVRPMTLPDGSIQSGGINPEYAKSLASRGVTLQPLDLPAIHAALPPAPMMQKIKRHFGAVPMMGGTIADPNAVPNAPLAAAYSAPGAPPPQLPLPPALAAMAAAAQSVPQPSPMPQQPVNPMAAAMARSGVPQGFPLPLPTPPPTVAQETSDDEEEMNIGDLSVDDLE